MSLQFSFLIVHAVKYLQRLIYPSEGKQIDKQKQLFNNNTHSSVFKNKETPAEVVLSSLHNIVVFTGIVL